MSLEPLRSQAQFAPQVRLGWRLSVARSALILSRHGLSNNSTLPYSGLGRNRDLSLCVVHTIPSECTSRRWHFYTRKVSLVAPPGHRKAEEIRYLSSPSEHF